MGSSIIVVGAPGGIVINKIRCNELHAKERRGVQENSFGCARIGALNKKDGLVRS